MQTVIGANGERITLQVGNLIFGMTSGGIFVPVRVDANGNMGVAGAAGSNTTAIDQTTPGTTNAVVAKGYPATFGVAGARFTSADQSAAPANVTDVPATARKLVILDIEISVDTAMRVDLLEETTGTVLATKWMAANQTVNLLTQAKRKLATADKRLQVQTSVAGNVSVGVFYYSE